MMNYCAEIRDILQTPVTRLAARRIDEASQAEFSSLINYIVDGKHNSHLLTDLLESLYESGRVPSESDAVRLISYVLKHEYYIIRQYAADLAEVWCLTCLVPILEAHVDINSTIDGDIKSVVDKLRNDMILGFQ